MEDGMLVEVVGPIGSIQAIFLNGEAFGVKSGYLVPRMGCKVNLIAHLEELTEAEWGELEVVMKVGWTDEARAGAAASRGSTAALADKIEGMSISAGRAAFKKLPKDQQAKVKKVLQKRRERDVEGEWG